MIFKNPHKKGIVSRLINTIELFKIRPLSFQIVFQYFAATMFTYIVLLLFNCTRFVTYLRSGLSKSWRLFRSDTTIRRQNSKENNSDLWVISKGNSKYFKN